MNRRALLLTTGSAALLAAGCSLFTQPISPTLIQDGQMVETGLQTLAVLVTPLSASAGAIVTLAAGAIQVALTDLQGSKVTPASFAQTVNDEITLVAAPLEADFKANTSIQGGVVALQGMITIIGTDLTPPAPAPAPVVASARLKTSSDPRVNLQNWIAAHR